MRTVLTPDALNAMTDLEYKAQENRLRRAAERQGLKLEKARVRDERAIGFGTYRLADVDTNYVVAHGVGVYGLGLDDVERSLFAGMTTVHVFEGRDPEDGADVVRWLDEHNPDRQPWIEYHTRNTTGARVNGKLIEDGWVLHWNEGDGFDNNHLGQWDDSEAAVNAARAFFRRWYELVESSK